jgi:beta-phosphoglucomutase family hydrolase
MLGLPSTVRACLFDLDGVLTDTASVHDAAWAEMFDAYLRERSLRDRSTFVPFDLDRDYTTYVDGRPRVDGVRAFLQSRGVSLPAGGADDPPSAETLHGLGNRKNEILLRRIARDGVRAYPGSVRYLRAVRAAGIPAALVSSSANAGPVAEAAGLADLLTARVDGASAARENLRGKPAPDTYLAGARALGVDPAAAAVFEDALAGVEAGRNGRFGYVVGVDRAHQADALRAHGADVVVTDLADLLTTAPTAGAGEVTR